MIQSVNHLMRVLEDADWTAHRGERVDEPNVRTLRSWDEVEASLEDDYAGYYVHEEANLIADAVTAKSMEAYRGWNDFVDGVRPEVEELVARKLGRDVVGVELGKDVFDHLNWIVLHAAVEIYYRRFNPRDFHESMMGWLRRGHVPVGWELGQYPRGRAVVY